MLLKGLQKLTLLDYPGKIAATVFTGGCNFRCPFCHNASLVIGDRLSQGTALAEDDFFAFLEKRKNMLEGICVSGGEPTLMPDLFPFLNNIKKLGYLVKLDTNGYRPDVLISAVREGLVDYVAMDIKNSKELYGATVGISDFDITPICESCEFLISGAVDFEFRTTLVKELHTQESIASIGRWLAGGEKYFLQTFEDSGDLISHGLTAFDSKETEALLGVLRAYIPNAEIR